MTGRRLATLLLAAALVAAGTLFYFGPASLVAFAKNAPAADARSAHRVSVPMFFEANQGQTDPRVKFLSRGHGYSLFLTGDEAVLQTAAVSRQPSAFSQ